MSVKNCEKLEKNQVALTVEVDAAAFDAAIEKAYRKVRHQINVPGFRKGKAPRKMIESRYGVEIFYDEAINIAMPDAYVSAVGEEKLEHFLNRRKFDAAEKGWYYSQTKKAVLVKYPNPGRDITRGIADIGQPQEAKTASVQQKVTLTVSFEDFDLIGM